MIQIDCMINEQHLIQETFLGQLWQASDCSHRISEFTDFLSIYAMPRLGELLVATSLLLTASQEVNGTEDGGQNGKGSMTLLARKITISASHEGPQKCCIFKASIHTTMLRSMGEIHCDSNNTNFSRFLHVRLGDGGFLKWPVTLEGFLEKMGWLWDLEGFVLTSLQLLGQNILANRISITNCSTGLSRCLHH